MNLISLIKDKYRTSPLSIILLAGLFLRLIAAIFSKGYGMFDDHFLIIEPAQSLADTGHYEQWLPWDSGGVHDNNGGHNWFYTGFHYVLFLLFNALHIGDPQVKMLLVRFIHAVYSLLVVVLGYRVAEKLSSSNEAKMAGWMLAALWFIPSLSVRNLVEWVCVPPMLASTLSLIRFDQEEKNKDVFLSGIWAGIAMGIRYQAMWFFAGIGLYLLIKKKIVPGIICLSGFLISFFFTQLNDLFIWHQPFFELRDYINYNLSHSTDYINGPWYKYFGTLAGMLVPPISVFLFAGYFAKWKRLLPLFIPSFIFFVFHCYFPNKQERFIFPFIPFLIIGGVIGWYELREKIKWKKFEQGSWKFLWIVNIVPLILFCTNYTKRSRVESMYYLYNQPDFNNFVMESSHTDDLQRAPLFYCGKWVKPYYIYRGYTTENFQLDIQKLPVSAFPHYILFFENDSLTARVSKFENVTGHKLTFIEEASPSFMDNFIHWLNPVNPNQPIYIYHTENKNIPIN